MLRCLAAIVLLAALPARAEIPMRDGVWAQSYTGRAADPAVRFGQLANGLRYAVLHNATPPGQMSLRMLVGTGSIDERDDQQGLAHFLEHMAFRGSTRIADGEMTRILQREGLSLGADTNAFTTQLTTTYQFDFPRSGAADIASGLMLFREIASELTLTPAAVDAERGVVLAEERARDTPGQHAQRSLLDFLFDGTLAPKRWPIGLTATIAQATPAALRDFYAAHYRPEVTTIVAVGDFDAATMEAAIRARFADWRPAASAAAPVARGALIARAETAKTFNETGGPQFVELAWVRSFDPAAETDARERRDLVRLIGIAAINQRLVDRARSAGAPFSGAQLSRANTLRTADLTALVVGTSAGIPWEVSLAAAVAEQRRAVRDGVSQAEIDRVVLQLRAFFTAAVARAGTRATPALAGGIVNAAAVNNVFTSPAQDFADFTRIVATVTPAEVGAALGDAFAGSGPLVFRAAAVPTPGGAAALTAAFDTAMRIDPGATAPPGTATWPYAAGAPGAVAGRREVKDLGLTIVDFANHVRLTVKPTGFAKDQVLVDVGFGSGRLGLDPTLARAHWLVNGAVPAFVEGGTGKLALPDLQRLLAGRVVGVSMRTGDTGFDLLGATRPADLGVQLELLGAYVADPGFRREASIRLGRSLITTLAQIDTNPAAVLARVSGPALHDGDRRWAIVPSVDDVRATKVDDIKALLGPALANGPLDVTIVGDIGVEAAIAAVAATFGALPPRTEAAPDEGASVRFPAPNPAPMVVRHTGRADQAIALAAWPAKGFFASPPDARALGVAAAVVKTRLFDQLREAAGLTYSPRVGAQISSDLPDYGLVAAEVEVAPAKVAGFFATLDAVTADLAARPVTADELARAKTPLVDARTRDLATNGYWLTALARAAREPRSLDAIRDRVSSVAAVTAADVQRVAATYLRSDRAYRLVVRAGEP